jgi:photosystem II stability/assembly factor-like uncharacterized protein
MEIFMFNNIFKYCKKAALTSLFIILINSASAQWIEQNSGSDFFLTSIHFINENTGLIGSSSPLPISNNFIGGEIIRTTNGGINWQRVLLDSNLRVRSFCFFDSSNGYAIGGTYLQSGKLIKTTNSGLNWFTIIDNINPTHKYFYNMNFANQETGYLSSFDGVYKSTNSGNNWSQILYVNEIGAEIFSYKKIHFFNVNTGIYLSDSGKIYKTTNAGNNWSVNFIQYQTVFRDIAFLDNSTGFAVGLWGKVIKTTDQGSNWQEISFGTTESLYSIEFTNNLTGYLTKDKGVLKSTDAGNSWFEVLQLLNDTLFSEFFLNPEEGFVAGTKGKLFKTTTGVF